MSAPFDLETYREMRQCLLSFVQGCGDAVNQRTGMPGYVCRYCFARGPWTSDISHGNHAGDPHGRPCRVVRARALLDQVQAYINSVEVRSGDSPVIQ